MDKHVEYIKKLKVEETMKNLKRNNMEAFFVKDEAGALKIIKSIINKNDVVSVGGSMTLFETGVINLLRNGDYEFLDRYKEGLTKEEIKEIYIKTFAADVFFTSTNAITEDGILFNVDGNGNRVAAMIYGPDRVIVVAGINKIVPTEQDAIRRVQNIAAPTNAHRLDRKVPCIKTGYCEDCNSVERICANYVSIKKQVNSDRIKVIIIDKEFGY